MTLAHLIAWRPLLAVAITVTFIAAGPEAPSAGHDDSAGDVNLDRPAPPRPPKRCRGPPQPSRNDPTATPHTAAPGTPHPPDLSHPLTTLPPTTEA